MKQFSNKTKSRRGEGVRTPDPLESVHVICLDLCKTATSQGAQNSLKKDNKINTDIAK